MSATVRSYTHTCADRRVCGLCLYIDHVESALRREKADALAAYRERYDCEDEATPADLIRRSLEAEAYEHDRFKARGGEIDDLTESLSREKERSDRLQAALREVARIAAEEAASCEGNAVAWKGKALDGASTYDLQGRLYRLIERTARAALKPEEPTT